jgi:hypothetical protein
MSADDFPPWIEPEEEVDEDERVSAEDEKYYGALWQAMKDVDDDALPPHKRAGWLELQYERADDQRKAAKEQELLQSINALEWATSTGAK